SGVAFDNNEADRAGGERRQNRHADNDQPPANVRHRSQILRASRRVMSSNSSGEPVHWRTESRTVAISFWSSRSEFLATRSIRRSSPNISPYSFSGSVMPSV